MGRPPAEPGALRDDWQQRAGLVGYYREVAGITDPAQAIGPVPSAQPDLAEMFHASVRALQLPDEAALLKAMGQGELEAAVDEHDRAMALAPADVQAEIDERDGAAGRRPGPRPHCRRRQDAEAQAEAETEAQDAAADLARLAVADAARQEWTEAHAGQAAQAEAAERELRHRGLAERIPVTDAEVAEASAQQRETPAIDPAESARWKAELAASNEAAKQDRREASARAARSPTPRSPCTAARRNRRPMRTRPPGGAPISLTCTPRWRPKPGTWRCGTRSLTPSSPRRRPAADYPAPDPAQAAQWRRDQAQQEAAAQRDGQTIEPEAGRETPVIDPAEAAQWKARQAAGREAYRDAQAEKMARLTPVTDAEVAKYCTPQPEAEPAAEPEAAAGEPARPDYEAARTRSPPSAPRSTSWPSRRPSGALRWPRPRWTSPWCTNPRPSLSLSPRGSLATPRATRSRPPRRTPRPRWRSGNAPLSCAFAHPGADRYLTRGRGRIELCFDTKAQLSVCPGTQKAPDAGEARPGPSGAVRCSGAARAPTAWTPAAASHVTPDGRCRRGTGHRAASAHATRERPGRSRFSGSP